MGIACMVYKSVEAAHEGRNTSTSIANQFFKKPLRKDIASYIEATSDKYGIEIANLPASSVLVLSSLQNHTIFIIKEQFKKLVC